MLNYTLGTIEASEALIKDLYIDLRAKVNAWSKITQQTPQARMGYVGQHLVSVVTGYPGGKSGARVWGDRIFEKCGIRRDEGGDGGKTLEIRGKRRLSARDGGANYQQS